MTSKTARYLTTRVGDQWYGIAVPNIIEVMNLVAFTEVAGTTGDLLGLITVRDQVMPLIDMRIHLGKSDATLRLNTPVIAVRAETRAFALVFDEADRVEEIPALLISPFADTKGLPFVEAVARLDGRLVLLLDTRELAERCAGLATRA